MRDSLPLNCPGSLKSRINVSDDSFAASYAVESYQTGNLVRTTFVVRSIDYSEIESVQVKSNRGEWMFPILSVGLLGPNPFQSLCIALKPDHHVTLSRFENEKELPVAFPVQFSQWNNIFPRWISEMCNPYETDVYRLGESLQFMVYQQKPDKTR